MNEEWRPFREGLYEVSSLGRVRRATSARLAPKGLILAQHVGVGHGYMAVGLRAADGSRRTRLVHRLVAEAFLGPCPPGMVVNHIDRTRHNNTPANLEYVTQAQNLDHSVENRNRAIRATSVLTEEDVRSIRARVAAGEPQVAVAAEYGMHKTNISCIVRRVTWRNVA